MLAQEALLQVFFSFFSDKAKCKIMGRYDLGLHVIPKRNQQNKTKKS